MASYRPTGCAKGYHSNMLQAETLTSKVTEGRVAGGSDHVGSWLWCLSQLTHFPMPTLSPSQLTIQGTEWQEAEAAATAGVRWSSLFALAEEVLREPWKDASCEGSELVGRELVWAAGLGTPE